MSVPVPSDETALNKVLAILPEITYRKGYEDLLYFEGKLFGGIYDNRLLLKITKASATMLKDNPSDFPYPGGGEMILFSEPYDAALLNDVVRAMCRELTGRK